MDVCLCWGEVGLRTIKVIDRCSRRRRNGSTNRRMMRRSGWGVVELKVQLVGKYGIVYPNDSLVGKLHDVQYAEYIVTNDHTTPTRPPLGCQAWTFQAFSISRTHWLVFSRIWGVISASFRHLKELQLKAKGKLTLLLILSVNRFGHLQLYNI